jgi:hypothetical protein
MFGCLMGLTWIVWAPWLIGKKSSCILILSSGQPHFLILLRDSSSGVPLPSLPAGFFFTGGNRAVYRDYRCYRWGTVTVPSGSNRSQNSNLNMNSKKMKKSIKITKNSS